MRAWVPAYYVYARKRRMYVYEMTFIEIDFSCTCFVLAFWRLNVFKIKQSACTEENSTHTHCLCPAKTIFGWVFMSVSHIKSMLACLMLILFTYWHGMALNWLSYTAIFASWKMCVYAYVLYTHTIRSTNLCVCFLLLSLYLFVLMATKLKTSSRCRGIVFSLYKFYLLCCVCMSFFTFQAKKKTTNKLKRSIWTMSRQKRKRYNNKKK